MSRTLHHKDDIRYVLLLDYFVYVLLLDYILCLTILDYFSIYSDIALFDIPILWICVVSNLQWLHKDSHLSLSIFKNSI